MAASQGDQRDLSDTQTNIVACSSAANAVSQSQELFQDRLKTADTLHSVSLKL